MDGKFNLAVNKGDVLEISYVGYTTKEIKIIDATITSGEKTDGKELPKLIQKSKAAGIHQLFTDACHCIDWVLKFDTKRINFNSNINDGEVIGTDL